MTDLLALGWPASRVVEALEAAARHCRIPLKKAGDFTPTWGASDLDARAFDKWVEAGAAWIGIEAEPVDVEHDAVEAVLLRASPAIVRMPPTGPLLVIVGRSGRRVKLLTPDLDVRTVAMASLNAALCLPLEAPVAEMLEPWLSELMDDPRRRARVRKAVVDEILQKTPITRCYLARLPPGASFWAQMQMEGVLGRAAVLVGAHAVQYIIMLAAWYALGSGAFSGAIDRAWLAAWALLVVTAIPVQILTAWLQGQIVIGIGTLLKRRLLAGTLRVDQDLLRRSGAGQLLGRALDAGAVEALGLSGGLFAVLALVEFVLLSIVIALGPGGIFQTLAFAIWGALTLALGWRSYKQVKRWTHVRRDMTGNLVEQMVGHRTRLAQQTPSRWHDGEDEALEHYLAVSTSMDRKNAYLRAMPQAWYVVGLATLLPTLLQSSSSAAGLALGIGGLLLGAGSLARLSGGISQIAGAATAWGEVKPLFDAAARSEVHPSPDVVASQLVSAGHALSDDSRAEVPLVDAADLVFSYPGRPQPVVRSGTLQVRLGDRILLEGPSGGGKSTFASLLAGLRQPQAGLLLLEGLDWQTVGPRGWRRGIAAAPQFHDNHVLSETFLFNLLMSRQWPPAPGDTREAEEVCRELGLGDLLARMPAGLMQIVGDTGWRLSHGEQSRLFMARALLQGAKVILLDESFAALDPKTVEQCLRCVLQRAPALVVIAHP